MSDLALFFNFLGSTIGRFLLTFNSNWWSSILLMFFVLDIVVTTLIILRGTK